MDNLYLSEIINLIITVNIYTTVTLTVTVISSYLLFWLCTENITSINWLSDVCMYNDVNKMR